MAGILMLPFTLIGGFLKLVLGLVGGAIGLVFGLAGGLLGVLCTVFSLGFVVMAVVWGVRIVRRLIRG